MRDRRGLLVLLVLGLASVAGGLVWYQFVRVEWVPSTVWIEKPTDPTDTEITISVQFGCGPKTRIEFDENPQAVTVRGYEEGRGKQWCSALNVATETILLASPMGQRPLIDQSGNHLFDNRCVASFAGCDAERSLESLPPIIDASEFADSPSVVQLPQLVGLPENQAREWAEQSGFTVIIRSDEDSTGDLRPDERITLTVDEFGFVTSAVAA